MASLPSDQGIGLTLVSASLPSTKFTGLQGHVAAKFPFRLPPPPSSNLSTPLSDSDSVRGPDSRHGPHTILLNLPNVRDLACSVWFGGWQLFCYHIRLIEPRSRSTLSLLLHSPVSGDLIFHVFFDVVRRYYRIA
ncbi:Replication factor A protein 1 [Fusarium oxysporum f. sp. albedinis]|nr:Replication factor A protein 1 [Fusarium oxysporum f. sp. albedinis]